MGEELINQQLVRLLSMQMGDREASSQQVYLSYSGGNMLWFCGSFLFFPFLSHLCSFLERFELIIECLDGSLYLQLLMTGDISPVGSNKDYLLLRWTKLSAFS